MLLLFFLHIITQGCRGEWALWRVLPRFYSLNWKVIAKVEINSFNLAWLFSVFCGINFASMFFSFCYFVIFFRLLVYAVVELLYLESVTCLIAEKTTITHHTFSQSVHHVLNISKIQEDGSILHQTSTSLLENWNKFTSAMTTLIAIT